MRTPLFFPLVENPHILKNRKLGYINVYLLFFTSKLAKQNDQRLHFTSNHVRRRRRSAAISAFCPFDPFEQGYLFLSHNWVVTVCIWGQARGGEEVVVQVRRRHLEIRTMTTLLVLLRNTGGQSLTLRHGLLNMDMTPLSFAPQITLKGITVTMWTRLSIAALRWGLSGEWMIISFSLLSLSLTCRNSQFMRAAPWPGKADASHRREKQPC